MHVKSMEPKLLREDRGEQTEKKSVRFRGIILIADDGTSRISPDE